ncbi:MAG: transglycosylase SLT domain-containing protein [Burkholderiales bacterium]
MTDRLSSTRGSFSAIDARRALTGLRTTLVALAGIATLVSLPGWLRDLEAAPVRGPIPRAPVSPLAAARPTTAIQILPQKDAIRHRALADFLAKRYRVSRDSLERFVRLAYAAGHSTQIDPLLILAVMAVESSFNPIAESVMGAKGLMQIMPEFHQDKLRSPHGGQANVLDPEINIVAGAKVLRQYATQTDDDLAAALRLYGGVGADPQNPYPNRVLSERQRLQQIVRKVQDRRAVQTDRSAGKV